MAREADHGFLTAMFERLADWHANVSPIVSIMDWDRPYGDLMLDITGVAHLFDGEKALSTWSSPAGRVRLRGRGGDRPEHRRGLGP